MITTQLHKMSMPMCKVCFAQKIVHILCWHYAQFAHQILFICNFFFMQEAKFRGLCTYVVKLGSRNTV